MRYKLGFLVLTIYVLSCFLQCSKCSPAYFQKYRERRAEIRKNRLKLDKALKRRPVTLRRLKDSIMAHNKANDLGLRAGNTSRPKWIKKHMEQKDVKSNMHLHTVVSKIFKGKPEINEIFDNQAQNLKAKVEKLQEQKEKLEKKGQFKEELAEQHLIEEHRHYHKCSDCSPTYVQKLRERRAEIRAIRLKNERAHKRRPDNLRRLKGFFNSISEAEKKGMPAGNTSHRKWIKQDMKQQDAKSNMHLHTVVSKVFKGHPEINEIFDNQAKRLKSDVDNIQKKKVKLEDKGQFKEELSQEHRLKNLTPTSGQPMRSPSSLGRRKCQDRSGIEATERQNRMTQDEYKLVQNTRKNLESSEKELKRLHKDHAQFTIPRSEADKAKLPKGHTNRNAWADKFVELEKAKSNIRRHERAGNYLQHVPGVSQALHEQADRLKNGTNRLESDMVKLKSEGSHDEDLKNDHDGKEYLKKWNYDKKVEKYNHLIDMDKSIISRQGKPLKLGRAIP
ncbi:uncharacterized protein FA14DRAFT_189349 [Meira miltonrushii]|uniref:Uncharacterized protein n=1 Tax=Meira miltonrushii TaxID=1280837 RepID=A0A316VIP1_9BASI|nr:uncharacterized protein FA14DRAFT_189349 [Meira miltonrushii]PWN35375.1 hypothetical protein FA14DRAFT_189349 [Meira miltonrushii]